MVFKISMNPENELTQIITSPDLNNARESAQEIDERYENVQAFEDNAVKFFMPIAYAVSFESRVIEAFRNITHWVGDRFVIKGDYEAPDITAISREKRRDWTGFTTYYFFCKRPDDIETLINIAPEDALFIPVPKSDLYLDYREE